MMKIKEIQLKSMGVFFWQLDHDYERICCLISCRFRIFFFQFKMRGGGKKDNLLIAW